MELAFEIDRKYMKDLKANLGTQDNMEVLRNAFAALEWMARETKHDRRILSVDEGYTNARQLALPILESRAN